MAEEILRVSGLMKNYETFTLNDISFSVNKGSIVGVVGVNGSGKTTTIKILTGLTIRDAGDIYFNGEKISSQNEGVIRDRMGFVFVDDYFYQEISLKQMKKIYSKGYSKWDEEIFQNLIEIFKLPLKQKISKLSTGMKAKFSIALALSHHAELLILDEPTNGLDPIARSELIDMLKDLADSGVGVLFSSHITSDIEKIADRIILMDDGSLVFNDTVENVLLSHCLIRGKTDQLTKENEKLLLNVTKMDDVFEAVFDIKNKNDVMNAFTEAEFKSANLEQIMCGNVVKNTRRIFK